MEGEVKHDALWDTSFGVPRLYTALQIWNRTLPYYSSNFWHM